MSIQTVTYPWGKITFQVSESFSSAQFDQANRAWLDYRSGVGTLWVDLMNLTPPDTQNQFETLSSVFKSRKRDATAYSVSKLNAGRMLCYSLTRSTEQATEITIHRWEIASLTETRTVQLTIFSFALPSLGASQSIIAEDIATLATDLPKAIISLTGAH